MKKILFLSLLILSLYSCENPKVWKVDVTKVSDKYTRIDDKKVDTKTTVTQEVQYDMTESQINDYCRTETYTEYGAFFYFKVTITKKYSEL